jgi:ribonuclease P protein subunit RPR2
MNENVRAIARQRISMLFGLAKQIYHEDPALAQRYVDMARRIAMAAKLRLPTEYRRQVCRHCKTFILPGINCRVRTRQHREPHLVITCLNCGHQTRILLAEREEAKTKQ